MSTIGPSSPADPTPNQGVNTGQLNTNPSIPAVLTTPLTTPNPPATPPVPSAPSTPPIDVNAWANQIAQYETRVRDLQSNRDRSAEEANRARAELEALKQKHTEILGGAAEAARQALEKASQLEQQLQQERARSLRAEALQAHPELAAYADLIPATANQEELNQRIAALVAAREKDLAAMQSLNTPQNPSRPTIPPMNPARPNPGSQPQPSTQQMQTDLSAAMEKALATGDWTIMDQALKSAINQNGLNPQS